MNLDNGQSKMKKKLSTVKALAVAVAAYAHNGRKIVRAVMRDGEKEYVSNRQLVEDYFNNRAHFVVNDHHCKEAEGIINYLQQNVIMQSLKGTPDRFLAQLSALTSQVELTVKDIGILAWAPKLADDYQKKDAVREISARYEHSSRYVGRIGDKIETGFTLIDKRYIKSMDCYAVYGYDDNGNCLFYWAKTLDKVCEVGRIHGRIKDHKEDEYRNKTRVTVLNYVKVL
ncbi:hypothetical protein UFOVP112_423 [uncultured Caudovirales phage]|uniref:Uncharacterized protein n=1 Tax=uncultured Caudovirales phage TaxID=2100421 RepID=A0A6J5L5T7_9CAUD|nr:hypothetical protein UFOVP112_423 [uncultured Caudovirales phage]